MRLFYFFLLALLLPVLSYAQRNCASMEVLERAQAEDPNLVRRMQLIEQHTEEFIKSDAVQSRAVVTIPVVVHVIYRTSTENISEAQILSQIDVLNKDFKALNADISQVPSEFQSVIGNVDVEFCLAKRSPTGEATTGINRKSTNRRTWGTTNAVKQSAQGGIDPWDASKYLNIWVCNIGGGILGYAQFPGGNPATDGVVLDYRYVGNIGTATSPFNGGRTATHEVGHWLNLRHIWGDANCGNDQVSDTPVHNASNAGCPAYPHYSTCTGTPLEMTMNYMDYTDDRCMYMFTAGQVSRMRAVLAPGGARESLLSSNGCQAPGGGGTTCNTATNLNTTNVTVNSATLNWNAASGATSYNVRIRPLGTTSWTNFSTAGTSLNVSNLTAATIYEFQVQTVCGAASSTNYVSANFATLQSPNTNCTDIYENNNTQSTAKTIQAGNLIQGLISSSSDEDWFQFTSSATQPYIRVTLNSLPADFDISLYRNRSFIGTSSNDGTLDESLSTSNRAVGTYAVRVFGFNGAFNASDCYELKVEFSASPIRESDIIIEEAVLQSFALYPNPAADALTLDIPIETEAATRITIFDMAGKAVQTTTKALSKGNTVTTLNVQDLQSGMYIVRVQNGKFIGNQKFIISR